MLQTSHLRYIHYGLAITAYHYHYSSKVFSQPILSPAQFWLVEVKAKKNKKKTQKINLTTKGQLIIGVPGRDG